MINTKEVRKLALLLHANVFLEEDIPRVADTIVELANEVDKLRMQLAGAAEVFEAFMPPEEAWVIREEIKRLREANSKLQADFDLLAQNPDAYWKR